MTAPRRPATGSQARSDRSRAVIIDETVRYILDEGFPPPSVRRITERAGVTWGVVQYHFGDLDGVLMAVVDKGFTELLEILDALPPRVASAEPAERTSLVVDTVWQAFASRTSMAALELLIATRRARSTTFDAHLATMTERLDEIGAHVGSGLTAADAARVGSLIWHTVRGLVAVQMLWAHPLDTSADRQMLIDVIESYLHTRAAGASADPHLPHIRPARTVDVLADDERSSGQ